MEIIPSIDKKRVALALDIKLYGKRLGRLDGKTNEIKLTYNVEEAIAMLKMPTTNRKTEYNLTL